MNKEILKILKKHTEKTLLKLKDSAHDINHVLRVYNLALVIAKKENSKVDLDVLQAAALLHDIGGPLEQDDPTGNTDHAVESANIAKSILNKLGIQKSKINHIKNCIISHRYKTTNIPETIEAKILFDSDKLDALGAIGVARQFVWIGRNNANIFKEYNIDEYIKDNVTARQKGRIKDKSKHSPQIEYELKIKHIKEKLYTATAKKICEDRERYYTDFLNRLKKEIKGIL